LISVKIDCGVLIVTVFDAPIVALSSSGPVGTAPHDQLPATTQLPLLGFHVQVSPRASSTGTAASTSSAAAASRILLCRDATRVMPPRTEPARRF